MVFALLAGFTLLIILLYMYMNASNIVNDIHHVHEDVAKLEEKVEDVRIAHVRATEAQAFPTTWVDVGSGSYEATTSA
jgi:hypothetical protein